MSAIQTTYALARFELRGVARSRWVTVGGAVFVAAAVAVALAGLTSLSELGLAGAAAATDGLVHVTLLLPPLIGLLLGAGSLARDRERGLLALVASQPIARWQVPFAVFVGAVLAVWSIVGFGFGAVLLVVAGVATAGDLVTILAVLAVSLGATAAAVAIGVLVSTMASTHHQATIAAASAWLLLALGMDLLLAGAAPGLRLGPVALLFAVAVNPIEAARVLALFALGDDMALGPFGSYLVALFGEVGAPAALAGVLAAWIAGPLALARWSLRRRDV